MLTFSARVKILIKQSDEEGKENSNHLMIVINNEEGEKERVNSKRNTSLVYSLLIDVGTKREKKTDESFSFMNALTRRKRKQKTSFPFPKIVITHLIDNNETLLETKIKPMKLNANDDVVS